MNRSSGQFYLFMLSATLCFSTITRAAVTERDRQFLIKAAQTNVNVIKLSRLARTRAGRTDVKGYAGKMVADHTALEKKLKPFAMAWSVPLPATPDVDTKTEYKKLRHLSGLAFQKEYVDVMCKDHNAVLEAFTHEANVASDADFKSTVIQEKSVIAAHTNMADDLKSKL
jgi:putative membrane protein